MPARQESRRRSVRHPVGVWRRSGEHLSHEPVIWFVIPERLPGPGVKMFQRGITDAVAAVPHQVAVPVTPVIYPGLALDQLVDQFVAFIRISAAHEGLKLIGSRDAPGQIEIDSPAEF